MCFAELPDTSIADTSTEELNTSLTSQPDSEVEEKSEKQGAEAEPDKPENTEEPEAAKEPMEVSVGYIIFLLSVLCAGEELC